MLEDCLTNLWTTADESLAKCVSCERLLILLSALNKNAILNVSQCHAILNVSQCHAILNVSQCHAILNVSQCHAILNVSQCRTVTLGTSCEWCDEIHFKFQFTLCLCEWCDGIHFKFQFTLCLCEWCCGIHFKFQFTFCSCEWCDGIHFKFQFTLCLCASEHWQPKLEPSHKHMVLLLSLSTRSDLQRVKPSLQQPSDCWWLSRGFAKVKKIGLAMLVFNLRKLGLTLPEKCSTTVVFNLRTLFSPLFFHTNTQCKINDSCLSLKYTMQAIHNTFHLGYSSHRVPFWS